MYIRLDDSAWPFSEAQVRAQTPDTSYPNPMPAAIPGFRRIAPMPAPVASANEVAVEVDPLPDGDEWRQQWVLRTATEDELAAVAAARVPQAVTRRQAKQALILGGLISSVQPAIDAIPDDTQRALIQCEWDDSQEFERQRPALIMLGASLGMTSAQLDALFIVAAAL